MTQIVSRHNSRTLRQHQSKTAEPVKTCSCPKAVRDSNSCPMAGQCLLENTIYQATVKQEVTGKEETYIGLASTSWKARLAVHTSSFKHRVKPGAKSQNSTELSKHIWELKDKQIKNSLSWKIIDRAQTFNPSSKMCRLCLTEKYHLMYNKGGATLNNRSQFYSACRHVTRKLISNGWNDPSPQPTFTFSCCDLVPYLYLNCHSIEIVWWVRSSQLLMKECCNNKMDSFVLIQI